MSRLRLAGLVLLMWVFSPVSATLRDVWAAPELAVNSIRFCLLVVGVALLFQCERRRRGEWSQPLWSGAVALLSATPLLWALLFLFAVSTLWSGRPELSALRFCWLCAMIAMAWYINRRLRLVDFVRVVAWSLVPLLVVSLWVALVDPESGTHFGHPRLALDGAWRGVIGHRNDLAAVAVIAALSLGSLALWARGRGVALAALGSALAVAMLWPTGSVGGLVCCLAAGVVLIVGYLTDKRPSLRAPALLSLVIAAVLVLVAREPLLELVGRDLTLSRRTTIWAYILEFIQRRPVLGYGYGLSWPEAPALQADLLTYERAWQRGFHSGYLAVAFWVGWPGLALLLGFLLRLVCGAIGLFVRGTPGVDRVFPLALMTALLLCAVSETRLMTHGGFTTVLLCALAFRVHDAHRDGSATPRLVGPEGSLL